MNPTKNEPTADQESAAPPKIIVYGHATCPGVPPVRGMLRRANVEFEYVDIRADLEAAARVRSINNGYESVPTLIFPDGSTLTEPSTGRLKAKLETMGYRVGWQAWIIGNGLYILMFAIVTFAMLRFLEII